MARTPQEEVEDLDAELYEHERQLRRYGFDLVEGEDVWCKMVFELGEYYDEHLRYPTKEEFCQHCQQEGKAEIERLTALAEALRKVRGAH